MHVLTIQGVCGEHCVPDPQDEANTADPAQRGPAEFVSGGGSALPVLREIGREIRAQRANVRSRSKAQRQAAGLAGGAPPVLRKGAKENRNRETAREQRRER